MRLAIDAMGTDHGSYTILDGVRRFLHKDEESKVLLVGDQEELNANLTKLGLKGHGQLEVVHATQVITMEDKIGALREKRDSSIARTVKLIKDGEADAMVALGNTMAAVATTRMGLGCLEGIHRAGIAVPMPTKTGVCVVIDMGANINVKPEHLYAYGVMASAYAELVLGTENPRVGLLNVGEEASKGNPMLKEAYSLLEQAPVNFVGNVEGSAMFNGECDVIVCDGFVGNCLLKASEEIASTFATMLKSAIKKSWFTALGAWMAKSAILEVKKKANYDQYGGAPLLGVNGICIIGHGRSNPTAVKNAMAVAREAVKNGVNEHIHDSLKQVETASRSQAEKEAV